MDGHSQCFDVVASIGPSSEIWQVELNLVPPLIQPHRHSADEGLNTGGWLIIAGSKSPSDILVVKNLHLKGKVLLQLHVIASTFLMIMTRKGSLIPKVYLSFAGQVTKDVVTLVPIISSTDDWISLSVSRLMCPFSTDLWQSYCAFPIFEGACSRWSTESTGIQTGRCS